MSKAPNSWKKYDKPYPMSVFSVGFFQKIIYVKDVKIGIDLVMFQPSPPQIPSWSYELHVQIPSSISKTGMTINTNNFAYQAKRLDWKKITADAELIVKSLTIK